MSLGTHSQSRSSRLSLCTMAQIMENHNSQLSSWKKHHKWKCKNGKDNPRPATSTTWIQSRRKSFEVDSMRNKPSATYFLDLKNISTSDALAKPSACRVASKAATWAPRLSLLQVNNQCEKRKFGSNKLNLWLNWPRFCLNKPKNLKILLGQPYVWTISEWKAS